MSILDRLNHRLVARLRRDCPAMAVEDDAMRLTSNGQTRRLLSPALTAATVLHRDVYSADAILLRLAFQSGDQIEVFQGNPIWEAVVVALDDTERIRIPSTL